MKADPDFLVLVVDDDPDTLKALLAYLDGISRRSLYPLIQTYRLE